MVRYLNSFHYACKAIIGEGVYDIKTNIELIVDSLTVIINSVIFSIVITIIGHIYDNMYKSKEELY